VLRRFRGPVLVCLALLVGLLFAGCGSDDDPETSSAPDTTTPTTGATKKDNKEESIEDAEKEFVAALDSGDCDRINKLYPATRPSLVTEEGCDLLKLFEKFEPVRSEDYGDGAVVDLVDNDDRHASALFVREGDGKLGLVGIDNVRTDTTVGSKPAKEFDDAAADAADALREKDCKAFIEVSYVRNGFAVGEPDAVCTRLKAFPVADLAAKLGEVPPEFVGGNSEYAFYSLGEGEYRVILIMAHQADLDELGNPPEVPEGGAEYSLFDAYPIIPPEPPQAEDSEESE
jgi:hypothetical protein